MKSVYRLATTKNNRENVAIRKRHEEQPEVECRTRALLTYIFIIP